MGFRDIDKMGADYGYNNTKSGAVGKYYLLWNEHGDNIKKITGAKTKEEFINSPELQEKYFKWYSDNPLKSKIERLKAITGEDYTDDQLARIIHFKGETGAKRYLEKYHPKKYVIPEEGPPAVEVVAPITTPDREAWEKMQAAAFQRGIYEDQMEQPEGIALMKEFGIDPARLPAYRADFAKKTIAQSAPNALPQVSQGFSSRYLYDDKTPRQRYVHYLSQRGNNAPVDYGTDIDAFLQDQEKERTAVEQGWAGFGDPTQDVNYHPAGWQSGFGASLGLSASDVPTVVDPRFPTRDPITGRVTPAVSTQ